CLDQPSLLRQLTSINTVTTDTQDEWYQHIFDYLSYLVLPPDLTSNVEDLLSNVQTAMLFWAKSFTNVVLR
ncbi:hypothetical protein KI387_019698, partial [Taxus chinensis]